MIQKSLALFSTLLALSFGATCDYRTQTQGDWGLACDAGNNPNFQPGCFRDQYFSQCFPSGLEVGCSGDLGFSILFTSSAAITHFLPQDPSARQVAILTQDWINSTTSDAGQCGGELTALGLSLGFDQCVANFSGCSDLFGDLFVCDGRDPNAKPDGKRHAAGQYQNCIPFYGWSIMEIYMEAQRVVGGCSANYTIGQINDCLALINQEFAYGRPLQGGDLFSAEICPVIATSQIVSLPDTSQVVSLPATSEISLPVTIVETIISSNPSTVLAVSVETTFAAPQTTLIVGQDSLQQDAQQTTSPNSATLALPATILTIFLIIFIQ